MVIAKKNNSESLVWIGGLEARVSVGNTFSAGADSSRQFHILSIVAVMGLGCCGYCLCSLLVGVDSEIFSPSGFRVPAMTEVMDSVDSSMILP